MNGPLGFRARDQVYKLDRTPFHVCRTSEVVSDDFEEEKRWREQLTISRSHRRTTLEGNPPSSSSAPSPSSGHRRVREVGVLLGKRGMKKCRAAKVGFVGISCEGAEREEVSFFVRSRAMDGGERRKKPTLREGKASTTTVATPSWS